VPNPKALDTSLIQEAAAFLAGRIRRTPLEASPKLSELLGVPVALKLESQQLTGSFKIRGALFRISRLTAEERRAGVLTSSAGNHGKAVAYAAREARVRAVICVPRSVDRSKHDAMVALGADVRVSEFDGYDDTEEWAQQMAIDQRLTFLSAFDDYAVMAANGTVALEVLEDAPDARTFIVPVGGGGLSAGFAVAVKQAQPDAMLIGCQHVLSPALRLSLDAGRAITKLPAVETLAGGVEGGIGALTFPVLAPLVDHVALVTEDEILAGVRWMLTEHQYLIEPTAAVALAACLTGKVGELRGPAVVVITGRNVSFETVRGIVCAS
jgi:threonine dehydratase